MTVFVDPNAVTNLIKTTLNVQPFIDTAVLVVNEDLLTKGMTEARLNSIALYLSAHFVALAQERGGLKSKKIGDAAETYQMAEGLGFAITRYGQQAIALDSSGTLRTLNRSGGTSTFRVV